jgi:Txe/YoeB family toxin of Txe-Axe toxin-antitoxin module
MKKELEDKIVGEFPEFFPNFRGDPGKTCLAWGLAIGAGWFDLFYKLCQDVKALNPKEFRFEQIKTKFGGLRAYCIIVEDDKELRNKVSKLVSKAESDSYKICEDCGSVDNVTNDVIGTSSWIVTMCGKCRVEELKRRNAKEKAGNG